MIKRALSELVIEFSDTQIVFFESMSTVVELIVVQATT